MKNRIVLTAFISLIIFAATIFSSCSLIGVKRLDKIAVNGDYTFVSNYGVTHNGKDKQFEKSIKSALKSNGEKVYEPRYSPSVVAYNNGKLFFTYNYYNKSLTDDWDSDYTRKFCAGYVDVADLSVYFLGCYQYTIPYSSNGLLTRLVGDALVLFHREGLIEIYNISTAEKSGEITAEYLSGYDYSSKECNPDSPEIAFYKSQTGKMIFIDGECAIKEVSIDFGESDITKFYGFTSDYLLFYSSSGEDIDIAAYDRQTYSLADDETAQAVREEIDNYNSSSKVEYGGETYTYSVSDEEIVFKSQSGEQTTLTITDLRVSSEELRKVEEIFGGELSFKQVEAANGELYIVAKNDESFFGMVMFSHVTPPIVFKYDMNGTFEYIGRASGSYVVTIIKN